MTLYDGESDLGAPEARLIPDRGRRWPKVLLAVVLLLAVTGVGGWIWLQRELDPPGDGGAAVTVSVPRGSSPPAIGRLLTAKGVIDRPSLFRWYVRLTDAGPFQAGDYALRRGLGIKPAVEVLEAGPELQLIRFGVPEGLRLEEVAERVGKLPGRSSARFLELVKSGEVASKFSPAGSSNLEGLLFPDTYVLDADADEADILRRMVARFDEVATEVGLARAEEEVGIRPYDAVVVASLIEREARVARDRPEISAVIYNRLEKGMPLQIDATVLYALGAHKTRVLFSDLQVDSPYNTYKVTGLPPGPIAGVGRAALEAALAPADGESLFYVVTEGDGGHSFAATLAEHNRNIRLAKERGLR